MPRTLASPEPRGREETCGGGMSILNVALIPPVVASPVSPAE